MRFDELVEQEAPRALVVFNGIMYPEAVARACARAAGVPAITHEVGLQPFSTFFSAREATFREVDVDPGVALDAEESRRLAEYLRGRFSGRFRMAGIDFWPEMQPLPESLEARLAGFRQTVAVFTNVVFDTSQVHANALFRTMFEWLEDLRSAIARCPDTLFVIRAHPDEDRPGKESQQSVAEWFERSGLRQAGNVAFLGPSDYISSYDLIRRSKLVLVYNSSVGLEAAIAGVPVLCAGRARYTQIPTVFFPATRAEYGLALEALLHACAARAGEIRRPCAPVPASRTLSRLARPERVPHGRARLPRHGPAEAVRSAQAVGLGGAERHSGRDPAWESVRDRQAGRVGRAIIHVRSGVGKT